MNDDPTYADGIKNERSRCIAITESWQRPSYIATHYGEIDAHSLVVLLKVVKSIEAEIRNGNA